MEQERATLTIQRALRKGVQMIYSDLFRAEREDISMERIIRNHGEDPERFGKIRFTMDNGGIFYEHLPNDERIHQNQLSFPMDIPPEWLFCFNYQEMKVIGITMGVFQANTTVELALRRLESIDIDVNSELFMRRKELYVWLKNNARLDDRIQLCSDWIYYHPEGKYDYDFVRKDINRRIALLKTQVHCEYWTNRKIS